MEEGCLMDRDVKPDRDWLVMVVVAIVTMLVIAVLLGGNAR
jgi:hypothetical protein